MAKDISSGAGYAISALHTLRCDLTDGGVWLWSLPWEAPKSTDNGDSAIESKGRGRNSTGSDPTVRARLDNFA